MKKEFIEIVSCDGDGGFLHHEIVNVKTIQNIFIVMPEETDIVIRCVYNKTFGESTEDRRICRNFTEHFADKFDCKVRYNELKKILVGSYSCYGADNLIREASSVYAKVKKELDRQDRVLDKYHEDEYEKKENDKFALDNFVERNGRTFEEVDDIMKKFT